MIGIPVSNKFQINKKEKNGAAFDNTWANFLLSKKKSYLRRQVNTSLTFQ